MKQNILIIDDFASVRLYHMSYLSRKGYYCIGASSGSDALAQLEMHLVDLVLLDMVMPEMSGEDFIARLDADPRFAHLPVLVITSEASVAQAAFAGSRRPLQVLAKPVRPAALLLCVQQLLPTPVVPAPAAAS